MSRLVLLTCFACVLPAAVGLSLASDIRQSRSDDATTAGAMGMELRHLVQSARQHDAFLETAVENMKDKILKLSEKEQTKLQHLVQGMFREDMVNQTAVSEFKRKHPEIAKSLMQSDATDDPTKMDPVVKKFLQANKIPILELPGMKFVEAKNIPFVRRIPVPQFIDPSTLPGWLGNDIPHVDVKRPNHPYNLNQLLLAMVNPQLLCYFYDNKFAPCATFNTCFGVMLSLSTLPPMWAKVPAQLPMLPANLAVSGALMQNGLHVCSMANAIVGMRQEPLAGLLWNTKVALQNIVHDYLADNRDLF